MYSLAFIGVTSFFLALLVTPPWRNLARRRGWMDQPDRTRHLHGHPIPRLGGVPIAVAYLGALGLLLALPLAGSHIVATALPLASRIFPAAALVFVLGLADDLRGLKPWQKLAGQVLAACLAFSGGVQVTAVAGFPVPAWLSLPLTLFWLVGCSNAFNLIDGVDGLAAGAGLFATVTILMGALLSGNVPLALASVPLAGALLGFLRYNFNPASIFLGDSGSLTVGFLLGCYGVLWSQKSATVLGMAAPLMALAVPLLDTAVAIARRFLRGQRIFEGDRGHMHHRLLDRGLTPRKVALLIYAACGLAAVLSLLASVSRGSFRGVVIVLFCAAAWIGVQHLGYVEFGVAGRMFIDGAFRRHLNSQLALQDFENSMAGARSYQERWRAIREACLQLGFTHAEMRIGGLRFAESLLEANGNETWDIQIPLGDGGYLRLARCFGGALTPTVLVPFAEAVHKHFRVDGRSAKPDLSLGEVEEAPRRSTAAAAGGR